MHLSCSSRHANVRRDFRAGLAYLRRDHSSNQCECGSLSFWTGRGLSLSNVVSRPRGGGMLVAILRAAIGCRARFLRST
jgi:hypothetical protein